uniref:hypothetical protein n=1 Tax=uncultured Lutibacter sp. TaxID=437739 RepID=UPI002633D555
MAYTKEITVVVNTKKAEKDFGSLGNVIQEQKDITIEFEKELRSLEAQLKNTSKGNLQAQKSLKSNISNIKEALKDQKLAVRDLSNEQRKQTKVQDLTVESATRNYGAIQLLDQVTGGMASQVRAASDATKLFNFNLKATRTALIATGIGAFVVALGLIVAYWDEIVEFIGGANKKLQEQIDLNNKNITNLSFELKLLESKEKILIAEGKSTKEVKEQKEKLLNLLILENDLLLQGLQTQILKEQSQAKELTFGEKALNLLRLGQGQPIKIISEITEEEKTRIDEITKAIQDGKLKADELKLALIELNKPKDSEKPKTQDQLFEEFSKRQDAIKKQIEDDAKERERINEENFNKNQDLQAYLDEREQIETDAEDERINRDFKNSQDRIKLEENVKNAKVNIANQTFSLLSEIAGKGSKVGKALA